MRRLLRKILTLSCLLGFIQASQAQYTINVDNPATWGTFVAPVGATITWSQNYSYGMTAHHVLVFNDLNEQVWECGLWCWYDWDYMFFICNISEDTSFATQAGYWWYEEYDPTAHGDFYIWNSGPLFLQHLADSIALVNEPYQVQLQLLNNWPAAFTLLQNPPGMQIQQPGNWLVWNPTAQNIGVHTVAIRAYDQQNQADTLTYQLFTGYNAPPQILSYSPESNASIPFGTQVTYQFAYQDTQGLPVTYQWYRDGEQISNMSTSYQEVLDEYGLNPEVKVVLSNGIARDSIVWNLTTTATIITDAGGVFTSADNPLLAWEHVDIGPNDSLVFQEGTCFYTTHDWGWIGPNVHIYGRLKLMGTLENPVLVISLKTASIYGNSEYPFDIKNNSNSHLVEYVTFENLGQGIKASNDNYVDYNPKIVIRYCIFDSCDTGIYLIKVRNAAIYGNHFYKQINRDCFSAGCSQADGIYLFNNFAISNAPMGAFCTGDCDALLAFNNTVVDSGCAFQIDGGNDIIIANNTLLVNEHGVSLEFEASTGAVRIVNNIIQASTSGYAILAMYASNAVVDYNIATGSQLYYNVTPGPHEIHENPQFVDPTNLNFNLQPTSPAINSAYPGSFPDPDCTPADRGALYYDQGDTSVVIQVTSFDPPFFIPAAGGTVTLNATLRNTTAQPETTFAWLSCYQPDSSLLAPLGVPQLQVIPASGTVNVDLADSLVQSSQTGLYAYQVNIGTYDPPGLIPIRLARVFFAKLTEGPVGVQEPPKSAAEISQFSLSCNPNPFNSQIRINLRLPSLIHVHLRLFDLLGRKIADLHHGDLPAGSYAFNWNADAHASGIYLLQTRVGDQTLTSKLLLVK